MVLFTKNPLFTKESKIKEEQGFFYLSNRIPNLDFSTSKAMIMELLYAPLPRISRSSYQMKAKDRVF
jgi:hypothetical protein